MQAPAIAEAAIHQRVSEEIFRRGEDYYRRGAVASLVRRGELLVAEVEGSDYLPYRVSVRLGTGPGAQVEADCTCPYRIEWGSWCKHIVATLLACLHEVEQETPQASVTALLEDLDREALVALIERLVEREPELAEWIARTYPRGAA